MNFRVLSLASVSLFVAAPAFAAPAAPASGGLLVQILPFIVLIAIFYFLLIRPQQQRAKQHAQMVADVKRGDTIVTQGGIIAKVVKVHEKELSIELFDGVRARIVRHMVLDVRGKSGTPTAAND